APARRWPLPKLARRAGLAPAPLGAAGAPVGGDAAWSVGLASVWPAVSACGMLRDGSWEAPPSRCFTSFLPWRRPCPFFYVDSSIFMSHGALGRIRGHPKHETEKSAFYKLR